MSKGDFVPNLYKKAQIVEILFFFQELKPCELTRDATFAGMLPIPKFCFELLPLQSVAGIIVTGNCLPSVLL
jgi:hypothetical protein